MTPQPTAPQRLERLLALVPWVAGHPDGVAVEEVCRRFELDRSELVRDLDTVMMVGVHPFTPDTMIEAWVSDDRVTIRYADTFARPLRLTATEAVGLIAAASGVSSVPGAPVSGALRRALGKLAAVVGSPDGPGVDVNLGGASPEVFGVLEAAIDDHVQVDIVYPDFESAQGVHRLIEPRSLWSSGGRWYLSAWCHRAEGERIFRIDRILEATRTPEAWIALADTDDASVRGTVTFDESLPSVVVDVDRDAAWILERVPVLESEDRAEALRVRLAVASPSWLARLLVQLGPSARVIEADPTLDCERLASSEAARILARYR